jgi:hypothetical protein
MKIRYSIFKDDNLPRLFFSIRLRHYTFICRGSLFLHGRSYNTFSHVTPLVDGWHKILLVSFSSNLTSPPMGASEKEFRLLMSISHQKIVHSTLNANPLFSQVDLSAGSTRIQCVNGGGGLGGVLGLKQINTCHKAPLQVNFLRKADI